MSSTPDQNAPRPEPASQEVRLSVRRIYVKDVSFETPNSPAVLGEEWKPKVDLQLNNDASRLDEEQGLYEVVLRVTATVTLEERTAFLAEVHQAGLFAIAGATDEAQLKALLGSYCPSILFPYAREAVSNLATRGGFPQFLLAPVNFDALYARHLEEGKAQGGDGGAAAETPS